MIKKLIYHLIVVFIIFSTLWFVIEKFSKFNPVFTAIQDIKFSDIYFSYFNSINPSSEIYIVDIGMKSHKQTRFEIAEFIEKVNKKHKPSVIGVDVYFEYNKEKINQKLISSLAMDNVVRMFKLSEDNFLVNGRNKSILYPDFSFLPGLDTNLFNKDGYTFGLGVATDHPCIRFYKPNLNLNGKTYNHFSKLVAQKHLNKTNQYINSEINFDKKIMINYNVDFSKNRISINDSSRYHELKDKIVLIGLNTYKNDGSPLYNYDIHFTPKNKNYIGRSAKDSYGIEIISTIISNIIYNDHLQYNKFLHLFINYVLSIVIYVILFLVFKLRNKYFSFLKIFFQTFGILLLVSLSIYFIKTTNYYLDLTIAIFATFIAAEIVKVVDKIIDFLNKYFKNKSIKI